MKSPRIAIYMRTSTSDQSHESQRVELEEYCTRRGWSDIQWFTDTASGAKQDREGMNRMMHLVRKSKLDVVLAFKLDRLARSLPHLAQMIAEFQTHGVALVCPSQGINTLESSSNPGALLQVNILAAVAQFERELITERVNAGINAARQRGVKLGRPNKNHRHLEAVRGLVELGRSAAHIGRALGIPYSSVTEMVRSIKEQTGPHPSDV